MSHDTEHPDTEHPDASEMTGPDLPASSRRRFLRAGAAAAAGATVGTVMAGTGSAHAANGDPVKIGQFNSGTAETTLSGSKLKVTHSANNVSVITGESNGEAGFGVLGLAGPTLNSIGVKGQGRTGVAGDGNFPGGVGVSGYGPTGVHGESPANNGAGVSGKATGSNSTGVAGTSNSVGVYGEGELIGVAAFSNGGDALNAHTDGLGKAAGTFESSSGVGVRIDAPAGPALHLSPGPSIPPAAGTWSAGDVVMNGGLWLCIGAGVGPQSRWVKLSRVYQPLAAPIRIYDSRPGFDPVGVQKGKLTNGTERVVDASLPAAVPAGIASAVEVNVTVTDTDSGGWLSLFANGVAWPGTSSINWFTVGMTIANGTTVAVDALARFRVRAAGSTHFLVDVTGYYT